MIEIKGSVNAIARIKGETLGCLSKLLAIKGAVKKMRKIRILKKNKIKKHAEKKMRLLLILFSLTILEMLIGRAREESVIKREYVGMTIVR